MKSTSLWTRQFQSVVDNGRNHSLVTDLPEAKGGINSGPTALELCVMGFSSCAATIFAMVAEKMRLSFEKLEVSSAAEQKNNAPTITDVHCTINILTKEDKAKVEKCFELTLTSCPVGILFKQAGINVEHKLVMLSE